MENQNMLTTTSKLYFNQSKNFDDFYKNAKVWLNDTMHNLFFEHSYIESYVIDDSGVTLNIQNEPEFITPDNVLKTVFIGRIDKGVVLTAIKESEVIKNYYKSKESTAHSVQKNVDYYIDNQIRIPNNNIDFIKGKAIIVDTNDNSIVLLEDLYELEFDENSYNITDPEQANTTIIKRSNRLNETYKNTLAANTVILRNKDGEFTPEVVKAHLVKYFNEKGFTNESEMVCKCHPEPTVQELFDLVYTFEFSSPLPGLDEDALVLSLDEMVEEFLHKHTALTLNNAQNNSNTNLMKDLIGGIDAIVMDNSEERQEKELGEISTLAKVNKSAVLVKVQTEMVDFASIDAYAKINHIVSWDIANQSMMYIKYIPGTATPADTLQKIKSKIKQFDPNAESISEMQNFIDSVDDGFTLDPVDDFINRIEEHNKVVKEFTVNARIDLLNIEEEAKEIAKLSDRIDVQIDWDTLSVFVAKKEQILHSNKGVVFTSNENEANLYVVYTTSGMFYIPKHLATPDVMEKYAIEEEEYYIIDTDVDFPFYQVHLNSQYLLIEKTDF